MIRQLRQLVKYSTYQDELLKYPKMKKQTYDLFAGIQSRKRISLAKSITLVESTRPDHYDQSQILLKLCQPLIANKKSVSIGRNGSDDIKLKSFRIGLSGPPGVGKSTFIEKFGMFLVEQGFTVAVLAVDPSSSKSGGSILGGRQDTLSLKYKDKTRMPNLSEHPNSYVRPLEQSPNGGSLGGVARNTMEAIILCEASGYDIVLIETVGVGQSETLVSEMVDAFVLLVPPAGGDELQGLKKGIVEIADLIIVLVNKADGELVNSATRAQIEYTSALKFVQPNWRNWRASVMKVSSLENKGIEDVWMALKEMYINVEKEGEITEKRAKQRKEWMYRIINDNLLTKLMFRLENDPGVQKISQHLEEQVINGEITPGEAADKIIKKFLTFKE